MGSEEHTSRAFSARIQEIGKLARASTGAEDVRLFKRLKLASRAAEGAGRFLLCFASSSSFGLAFAGMGLVSFHLSLESQLNHSVMHGAFLGLPGAEKLTTDRYETLAVPFQSKTWRDAHRIHHASPSILGRDPDTLHPLFRVHDRTRWRPWHLLNSFIGAVFVFECWAFDYDRFLKEQGARPRNDRGEIRKFALFIAYQYVLFALIAGSRWKISLLATLAACVIRNFVFTGLQTGSSVGHEVSTIHAEAYGRKNGIEWIRFQIESSKNFVIRSPFWRKICGGLDRHIEHHLYPNLPPNRLHAISAEIRDLCREQGVSYVEYGSFIASLRDSASYLAKLSRRAPGARAPAGP